VPVARVELKVRARYHLGQQPGVPGRHRLVRIPVMDRCRHGDGTELETPGPHEHPQVLGDSPAAAAERLGVPGQEGRAHAGLGQRAAVRAGQPAGGKAEEQARRAAGQRGQAAQKPAAECGSVPGDRQDGAAARATSRGQAILAARAGR
jgi:hypothetical protein